MPSTSGTIAIVAVSNWAVALINGALRVVIPLYFASTGLPISKIAFFFFLFKFAEIFAPIAMGLALNRFGYKRTLISALTIHTLLSGFYIVPSFILVYLERVFRGLLPMADLSAVYVKHYSKQANQPFVINMILGMKETSKAIGMMGGGLLMAVFSGKNTFLLFATLTALCALVAMRCLPDSKEQTRPPVRRLWSAVHTRIKTLGLGFGLLNGALDAWGVVVFPIYLAQVFALSPALVGTVMTGAYVFQGLILTCFSKYVPGRWQPRTVLITGALLLIPVSLALSVTPTLRGFLALVFIYIFLFSVPMMYYNHLMLEFASEQNTSLDVATYRTLTNLFKPVGVFVSGLAVEFTGFSWAYYFAAILALLSAVVCLALPRTAAIQAVETDAFSAVVR
jgi:predicted MFS family arabinose efflux permease